jgi:hypothetical protein
VATADQERHRRLGKGTVFQLIHADVRGEVVDPVQRLAERVRVRLGRRDAHQERAREPGPGRDGDPVQVGGGDTGLIQGPLDGRHHRLQMRPGGDFGDDAAEARVLVDAGGDRVGEERGAADDADAGLVAGGLDTEDEGFVP